jgi:hypothetical protein
MAKVGIHQRGKPVAGAGDGMQVDESRFSLRQGEPQRHARSRSFMQPQDVPEIAGHVAQKGQFR